MKAISFNLEETAVMNASAVKVLGGYSLKLLKEEFEKNRREGWQADGEITSTRQGNKTYYQLCLKLIP